MSECEINTVGDDKSEERQPSDTQIKVINASEDNRKCLEPEIKDSICIIKPKSTTKISQMLA
jgi:hypothetical protein